MLPIVPIPLSNVKDSLPPMVFAIFHGQAKEATAIKSLS